MAMEKRAFLNLSPPDPNPARMPSSVPNGSRVHKRPAYSYRHDPAVPAFPDDRPIVLFDGHCALCSGWVRLMLRHDRGAFRFLPGQAPLGQALYRHYGLDGETFATNILLQDGMAYLKADGCIRMAAALGVPWSAAAALRVLPRRWQDWLYDRLARNRFRLFGRHEACLRAQPGEQDRFLP